VPEEPIDYDFVIDLILELLEIHPDIVSAEIGHGDIPFLERLDALATDPATRETVSRRVAEAQAAGRAFPLATAKDLAAARERQLAHQKRP
jgi:hypothetical protein